MSRISLWRILIAAAFALGLLASAGGVNASGQQPQDSDGLCPGWETRLWIGAYGRVTGPGGNLRLRAGPSLSDKILIRMLQGYKFTVIGGPVCADGYNWWKIEGERGTGWSVEAGEINGKTMWFLAPMTDPPTEPAPTAEVPTALPVTEIPATPAPTESAEPVTDSTVENSTSQEEPSWWCKNIGWFCDSEKSTEDCSNFDGVRKLWCWATGK